MLLTGAPSIRDVILFPLMKPKSIAEMDTDLEQAAAAAETVEASAEDAQENGVNTDGSDSEGQRDRTDGDHGS